MRHFLPVQPSGQYSVAQFESDMNQALPAGNHLFYSLGQASADAFLEQFDKPNDAIAFLGNSLNYNFSGGVQSIGLCLASECLEKIAIANDPSYPQVSVAGLATSMVDGYLLAQKSKVVFVGSGDDGALVQELWGISASTPHQALIVPASPGASLQQAAQVWVAIAQGLGAGQTVEDAVANADAQLGTAWTVVGDGTVRVKAVQ